MKQIFSLLLYLCTLLPALAEAPGRAPLPAADFHAAYTTAYTAAFGGIPLSWITDTTDDGETWLALMDGQLPMAMVSVRDGLVTDVAVLYDAAANDEELFSFILMCGVTGAALLAEELPEPEAALSTAVGDVYDALDTLLASGMPTVTLWGAESYFEFELQEDSNCHYLLVLDLSGEVLP